MEGLGTLRRWLPSVRGIASPLYIPESWKGMELARPPSKRCVRFSMVTPADKCALAGVRASASTFEWPTQSFMGFRSATDSKDVACVDKSDTKIVSDVPVTQVTWCSVKVEDGCSTMCMAVSVCSSQIRGLESVIDWWLSCIIRCPV